MRRKFLLTGASLLLLSGIPAGATDEPNSGGRPAERTRAAYAFECGGMRSSLVVEERVRGDDDRLAWPDRWRISLVSIDVQGRRIAAPDQRRLGETIGRYAWLTRVRGSCSPNSGAFAISVEGMLAQDWADFTESDDRPRPRTRSNEIGIARDGTVTIS